MITSEKGSGAQFNIFFLSSECHVSFLRNSKVYSLNLYTNFKHYDDMLSTCWVHADDMLTTCWVLAHRRKHFWIYFLNIFAAEVVSNMQTSFTACRNYWELLSSGVIFVITRQGRFMENENLIWEHFEPYNLIKI